VGRLAGSLLDGLEDIAELDLFGAIEDALAEVEDPERLHGSKNKCAETLRLGSTTFAGNSQIRRCRLGNMRAIRSAPCAQEGKK
jgi:hypothetical protein